MSEMARIHTVVRGMVQGIGYRWFVQREAKKLNLTGWVKNLRNGDVEIEAEGNKEDLNKFLYYVRNNHPWARVDELTIEWMSQVKCDNSDFSIRF